MKYDAVLFDLDGTILETIPLWQAAYLESLQAFGVELDPERFMSYVYVPRLSLTEILLEHGITDKAEHRRFRAERDEHYKQILRRDAAWIPRAQEILSTLKGKVKTGIVTGSWRQYVDAINEKLNLYDYFDTVVTEDDAENGKPAPDPLLLAAKNVGVEPGHCIYIGDMPFDVEAANRAGMTSCLVWGSGTPIGADEGAKVVCKDLSEILSVLS